MPGRSRIARRLLPFAGATVLGLLLGVFPSGAFDPVELTAALGLTAAVFVGAVTAPWGRLPGWAHPLPSFGYLLAVALLRDAAGGSVSGFGPLVLLPVFWVALYGTRLQLTLVVAGVTAVFYAPMLAIGGDAYPIAGWRGGALFAVVAAIVGYTVQDLVARLRAVLQDRNELTATLEQLAETDPLTGLANRRAWDQALRVAIGAAREHGTAVCVAVLDLDHFKRVNDDFGHAHGDKLLRNAAGAWRAELGPSDLLARLGGEEFAVLLTDCSLAGALAVTERVRSATPSGQTCSAGVAEWDGGESPAALLARADRLLYKAKQRGRDRSVTQPAPRAQLLRIA